MLTYDLAKKLKDAGFPQHQIDMTSWDGPNKHQPKCTQNGCAPTLEELIEACDCVALFMMDDTWIAGAGRLDYDWDCEYEAKGKTPEEAVANLWLKLNENKSK